MSLSRHYNAGVSAALEKLAVSGKLYAAALQNAAERAGKPLLSFGGVAGQARAARNPLLSLSARGTVDPMMSGRAKLKELAGVLQPGSAARPASALEQEINRKAFQRAGTLYEAQPGMEEAIRANFGPPRPARAEGHFGPVPATGHEPLNAQMFKNIPVAADTRRYAGPAGRGVGKSRSPEAFDPTSEMMMPTGRWGGDATMPEHLHSIPGMPAWAPR